MMRIENQSLLRNLTLGCGLLLIACFASIGASAASTNASPPREVTLAILPFNNVSGKTNTAHWKTSGPKLVGLALGKTPGLRLLPSSTIDFAVSEANLIPGPISDQGLRNLGQIMEAQYVMGVNYTFETDVWKAKVQIVSTTSNSLGLSWEIVSTNWVLISAEIADKFLSYAKVGPVLGNSTELQQLAAAPEATEVLLRAGDEIRAGRSAFSVEKDVRQALSRCTNSAYAWNIMANVLLVQGWSGRAREAAQRAATIDPRAPDHQLLIANILAAMGSPVASCEDALEAALRLGSTDPWVSTLLARLHASQGNAEKAISNLERAKILAPYDPLVRAELARIYVVSGNPAKAEKEMQAAERYLNAGFQNRHTLGDIYLLLNRVPEAVSQYSKMLEYAKTRELGQVDLTELEQKLAALKETLKPRIMIDWSPKRYSSNELTALVEAKLTQTERRLVEYPFASTSEMKRWAEAAVVNATNAQSKAFQLFNKIVRRPPMYGDKVQRTAIQAFEAWDDPTATFNCREHTYLYVAMARSIGLEAYLAQVDSDFENTPRSHVCAAVFLSEGKMVLVDPTYLWFGVPHKSYKVQDDLYSISMYLSQTKNLEKARIAVKLTPDSAWAQFNLALSYMVDGRMDAAKASLADGVKIDKDSWRSLYTQGVVKGYEGNLNEAISLLEKSIALNEEDSNAHFFLGRFLLANRKIVRARQEFRIALQGDLPIENAREARKAIMAINVELER